MKSEDASMTKTSTTAINKAQIPPLAVQANRLHRLCLDAQRAAAERAREAGEVLSKAKSEVVHGEWEPWLNTHCTFSIRTAQRYMLIASKWDELQREAGAKTTRSSFLTIREALRILTTDRRSKEDDDKVRRCPACNAEMAATSTRYVTCVNCWDCRLYEREGRRWIWSLNNSERTAVLGDAWEAMDRKERKQFLRRAAASMGCRISQDEIDQ